MKEERKETNDEFPPRNRRDHSDDGAVGCFHDGGVLKNERLREREGGKEGREFSVRSDASSHFRSLTKTRERWVEGGEKISYHSSVLRQSPLKKLMLLDEVLVVGVGYSENGSREKVRQFEFDAPRICFEIERNDTDDAHQIHRK